MEKANVLTVYKKKSSKTHQLSDISVINNFFGDLVKADPQLATPFSDLASSADSGLDPKEKFIISPIDIYTTFSLLQQVKADSAMGPDDIVAFFLKKMGHLSRLQCHAVV